MKTMKTTIMKPNLKFLAIVASVGLILQSCSSDDDEGAIELNAPVITNFEFGEGHHDEDGDDDHDHDSEEAYAFKGSDIHLAAEIAAEATVSSITLSIHADEVTADASFIDDLGADSLDTVELVMALEEAFECEIPDEEAEKITTVKEAVAYINSVQS